MVLAGQYLERPTVVPVAGLVLEGLSHRGDRRPPLLLCPPLPSAGGGMDLPVMSEVAFSATRAGHATLRFNHRGVGASQGARGGRAEAVEDAAGALNLLLANSGASAAAVMGYGAGAAVAMDLATRANAGDATRVELAIVVAPRELDLCAVAATGFPVLFLLAGDDPGTDRLAVADHCQRAGDRLIVVPGANHAFDRGLSDVGRAVVDFLATSGR